MKRNKWVQWGAFFLIVLIYLIVIRNKALSYSVMSDENTYFYMAKLMGDGVVVYKDFFFAHPPMQLFILTLVGEIFGFSFIAMKLVAVAATIVSALFLFLIMQRFELWKAILSVFLFLTSYSLIWISTQGVGLNLTLMFIISGVYFLFEKKNFMSGVFLGAAGLTGIYALPAFAIIGVYLFLRKKKWLRFLSGFLAVFGVVNIILLVLYGAKFYVPVYLYHFLKSSTGDYRITTLFYIIKMNFVLFLGLVLGAMIKEKKKFEIIYYLVIGYLVFFLMLKKPFIFYYTLIFPMLAMLFSLGLDEVTRMRGKQKLAVLGILIIILGGFNIILFEKSYQKPNNQKIMEAVNLIRQKTNINEEIFGDVYATPLIAFLSDRKIALNEIDTTLPRVKAGLLDVYDLLSRLDKSNMRYFILAENRDLHLIKEVSDAVEGSCELDAHILDETRPIEYNWLIYRCE